MTPLPPRSLARPSLATHWRALWAIARKDWKHFWRYPLNAAARAFQPIVGLAPVYFLGKVFSVDGQALGFAAYSGTTDYMSFIIIGTVLNNFVFSVFWDMGFSLKNDMDRGVLESNWLAPLPRLLMLVGRTVANLLTTAVTSAAILALAALLFGFNPTGSVLTAVLIALPMLLGLYGFGFAFAALVLVLRDANTMVDVSSFVVQVLSGSNFPVLALPRWLLPVALMLPLTYGMDAIRGTMLGAQTLLPIGVEIGLLLVFMVVMLVFGWVVFNALERHVRQTGTLGTH